MSRTSRRGMADLIVMIVMIVFLLGMGTLAFLTYDKAQKEKQYLAALREIPARQQAEMNSVKARYAEVCMYIGFKGEAAVSSPAAIESLLDEGAKVVADYYSVDASEKPLQGTKAATITVRLYDKEKKQWTEEKVPIAQVNDTRRNESQIYQRQDTPTIQAALGRQDEAINGMFTRHIPRIREQRAIQKAEKDRTMGDKNSKSDTQYGNISSEIESANAAIKGEQDKVSEAEKRLAEALKKENDKYALLDSESVRDAREEAFAAAREAATARRQAREAMEAYRIQADKRRRDDSRDPDGAIFLVDTKSGYVWINIGQKSDVHKNQTFQVLRSDASRSSDTQIGEIRVQEVLRGNIARCRVDALDDPNIYPEAGDIIKNPNFSKRQYYSWALVGEFGGQFTSLTRQQLTDLMRGLGFRVQSSIDATTDAVIIGGNWDKDPEFMRAEERRLNFEKYPEREVLYFLGMVGPDQKRD